MTDIVTHCLRWWDCMDAGSLRTAEEFLSQIQCRLQDDLDEVAYADDLDWYKKSLRKNIRVVARLRVWIHRRRFPHG